MSNSQKISQFISQNELADSDLITFVRSGQNLNIPFATLKEALGVTGSIRQAGESFGVPILTEPTFNDYRIKALESSKGIIAAEAPSGAALISSHVQQGETGEKIIADTDAAQYLYKSLSAGEGVSLSTVDDHIVITAVDAVVSSKTVVVASMSDFPAAIGGIISLLADTNYFLVQDVSTSNRFTMQETTTISGSGVQNITFTYTGSGDMFTSSDVTNSWSNLRIDAPNGRVFNWSTTVQAVIRVSDVVIVRCDKIGLFGSTDGLGLARFTNVSPADVVTDGLEFSGNWNGFVFEVSFAVINGGAYFNLGTATFLTIVVDIPIVALAAGTNFISGLTGSGNINTGGIGIVTRAITSGDGTPLSGVSTEDALWSFAVNNVIPTTRPDGLLSYQTPTATVLAAATPALITGAWVVERTSQMSGTVAGRLTYNGGADAILPITATLSIEPVSGTNKEVNIYLAKNSVFIAASRVNASVSSGSPKNQTVSWQDLIANGDFYEIFIESIDGTDLQVNTATLRIN